MLSRRTTHTLVSTGSTWASWHNDFFFFCLGDSDTGSCCTLTILWPPWSYHTIISWEGKASKAFFAEHKSWPFSTSIDSSVCNEAWHSKLATILAKQRNVNAHSSLPMGSNTLARKCQLLVLEAWNSRAHTHTHTWIDLKLHSESHLKTGKPEEKPRVTSFLWGRTSLHFIPYVYYHEEIPQSSLSGQRLGVTSTRPITLNTVRVSWGC